MFAPVSFVVRKRGHDPEVDLREGHLLEGTAREAEYEKCLTCFDFFLLFLQHLQNNCTHLELMAIVMSAI